MAVVVTPESNYGKELLKWDTPRSRGGMRPDRYEPFPKMLYMAQERPDGIPSVGETRDGIFGGTPGAAEAFTRTCQRTVRSEAEMARALEEGWRSSPLEALARREARDKAIADVAAHRHYEDRNMSPAAQGEAKAADAATIEHVPEVPEKRRRRRRQPAAAAEPPQPPAA